MVDFVPWSYYEGLTTIELKSYNDNGTGVWFIYLYIYEIYERVG